MKVLGPGSRCRVGSETKECEVRTEEGYNWTNSFWLELVTHTVASAIGEAGIEWALRPGIPFCVEKGNLNSLGEGRNGISGLKWEFEGLGRGCLSGIHEGIPGSHATQAWDSPILRRFYG